VESREIAASESFRVLAQLHLSGSTQQPGASEFLSRHPPVLPLSKLRIFIALVLSLPLSLSLSLSLFPFRKTVAAIEQDLRRDREKCELLDKGEIRVGSFDSSTRLHNARTDEPAVNQSFRSVGGEI
jgi:hypothetical protein